MRLSRRLLFVLGAASTFVLTLVGQSVRVLSVSGEATIQAPDDPAPRVLKVGDTIVVGTRIVTGDGSRVILTPLPGVKSIIAPGSDLVIERVSTATPAGSTVALQQATLDLRTGAITSDLEKTEGVALDYQIRTARGVAGARGTTYTVAINLAGVQTVVVTHGNIALTLADGRVVNLVPGQISITRTDGTTQAVTRASDLPAEDRALAEQWMQATLDALIEAVEQGVDIQSDALDNAARVAEELGLALDQPTRDALDRARVLLEERDDADNHLRNRLDDAGVMGEGGEHQNTDVTEIVTESRDDNRDPVDFLSSLTAEQRAVYDALSESQKRAFAKLASDELRLLVLNVNESPYSDYALALDDGDQLVHSSASIRYAGNLTAERRTVFFERSTSIQALLASRPADSDLRAFALDQEPETQLPPDTEVVYYAQLSEARRTAFVAFASGIRIGLADANDPALTTYAFLATTGESDLSFALNLEGSDRTDFLRLPLATQTIILSDQEDSDLFDFATDTDEGSTFVHSTAVVAFYAGLDSDERTRFATDFSLELRQAVATDPVLASLAFDPSEGGWVNTTAVLEHYRTLTPARRTDYAARPPEIRQQLADYDKPAFTDVVLDPATFDEGAPTDLQLGHALAGLLSLDPANQALFETFAGGPTYSTLDSAPSPDGWSNGAFTRTRNSFASLQSAERDQLVALGAGESIMDRSGTYLEAALADFNQLGSGTRTAISALGWGRDFTAYFSDEKVRALFANAADFTAAERNTVQQFGFSPHALLQESYYDGGSAAGQSSGPGSTPRENLTVLAALPAADRALLAGLNFSDRFLSTSSRSVYDPETESYTQQSYADILADTLDFARALTSEQKLALVEMGATDWLHDYAPDQEIYYNYSQNLTAAEVVAIKIDSYLALSPARQAAARETDLFAHYNFYQGSTSAQPEIEQALDAWLGLSSRTRGYLASESHDLDLIALFQGGGGESQYRSLSEIDTLVSSLDDAAYATLLDLDAADALTLSYVLDSDTSAALGQLQTLLGQIASLGDTQRFALRELGIVGPEGDRLGVFYSDPVGLSRLLAYYAGLDGDTRADTRQINPHDGYRPYIGDNFFFAADVGGSHTTYDVVFRSTGDLRIGATRRLAINGYEYESGLTFDVPAGKDLHLRASDLIELTNVRLSSGIRAITMEAVTINLSDFNFPEGSRAALTSRDGGLNFGESEARVGDVNFIQNVTYGGNPMFDNDSFHSASRGNINIGSFANPAQLPANYTPPQQPPVNPQN